MCGFRRKIGRPATSFRGHSGIELATTTPSIATKITVKKKSFNFCFISNYPTRALTNRSHFLQSLLPSEQRLKYFVHFYIYQKIKCDYHIFCYLLRYLRLAHDYYYYYYLEEQTKQKTLR